MKNTYQIKFYYFSGIRIFSIFTYFSILVYLPTLLNHVYNISEGISGILFLPITVSVILGSMFYKNSQKYNSLMILRCTIIIFSIFTLLFGIFNSVNLIILSFIIFVLGFCWCCSCVAIDVNISKI